MNDYNFGNFLCHLREKKGLTQAELAGMLGVTPAAVSKWENGASKPRTEVLFQLAEILGVKPEELMAGRYIPEESLDPVAIKSINQRYEYLRKTDSHETTEVKLKRIGAFLIDWNICGVIPIALSFAVTAMLVSGMLPSTVGVLLTVLCILAFPILFVLRDVIFGKRSLGKRMLGLVILDKDSAQIATRKQRFLRNILFFIAQVDFIILLVRGRTVGDELARTIVVNKKDVDAVDSAKERESENANPSPDQINSYEAPKKSLKKLIIIVAVTVVLFFGIVAAIVAMSLSSVKNTPEYALAYDYLISSEAFKDLEISEDDVSFNSYNYSSYVGDGEDVKEYGFIIKGVGDVKVILHRTELSDSWYVCEDCTMLR